MIKGFAQNPTDGVRISYEVDGPVADSGCPSILFLHGSGLSKASWRGLGYVRAFREDYRVITADLRGHGLSDKPHDMASYSRELFAGDIEAVLDAAGVAAAHIVGYSVGARLALEMVASRPERILSAVLLGGSPAPMAGQVASLFFPDYLRALRAGGMPAFIAGWEAQAGSPLDPSTRGVFERNDPLALAAYFEHSDAEPGMSDDILVHVQTPTLWMAGSRDNPRCADSERAASIMDARFVRLEGRNHGTTLFPSAEVIAEIRAFIGAVDSGAVRAGWHG